jgi:hypothetical protein
VASVALVRSATAVSNSGVTSLSVNLPASAAVGDYLVVTVDNANNNSTGFLNANLSTATVADNATSGTNTYTRQTSLFDNVVDTNGNFDSCGAVVFVAPVVRTNAGTFTVTVTTSVPIGDTFNDLRITVSEWSGVAGVEGFSTLNSAALSIYDYTPYAPLTATVPGDMLITFQTIAGDAVTNRAGLGTSNVLAWTGSTSVEYLAIANARQVIGMVFLLAAAEGNSFSAANIALLLKSTNATVASVPGHNVEFNVCEFPISAYDVWDGFPRIPSRTYDGLMFNRRAAAAATVPFTLRAKDFPNPTTRPVAAQQEVGFNNTIRQVAPAANPVPLLLRAKDFPNPTTRPVAAQQEVGFNNTIRHALPPPVRPVDAQNPSVRVYPQPDVVQNTTIRQVPPPPVRPVDAQNPSVRVYPQPDVVQNTTIRQALPPPVHPVHPVDAQNPSVRVYPQPDVVQNTTIRQVPPPPVRPVDAPNPSVRVYPQPDVVQNTTIHQVPPPPVRPVDAQNPSVRVYPQPDVVQNTTIRQVPPPPVRPVDAQNPSVRVYPQPDVVQNTTIRQVPPPPVRPLDAQNPSVRVYPQLDIVQNTLIGLVAPPNAPFKGADLPNPVTRAFAQQDVGVNYTISILGIPAPFKQADWPNPQFRAPRGISFDPAYLNPPPPVPITILVTGVTGFGTIGQVTVQITPSWVPINDSQTANWGVISGPQTPNWIPVVDTQTPGWAVISDPQTPNWAVDGPAPTITWTTITDAQTPNWGVVLSPQTSNWVQVDESQPSNWTLINDAQNPDWE